MDNLVISDNIFNLYPAFILRNKEVTADKAYEFVAKARMRNMNDFNIARMINVRVGDSTANLLKLLTN